MEAEQESVKPGWRTSEFWGVQVGKLVAVLVSMGVITQEGGDLATKAAVAIAALIAVVYGDRAYLAQRVAIKLHASQEGR